MATARQRPSEHAGTFAGVGTAIRSARSLAGTIAVAATPRYRATQRVRLRDAAQNGMAVILVLAVLDCLWLVPIHPDAAWLIVGLSGAVAAVAAIGLVVLASRPRIRPEVVILAALAAVDATTMALATLRPDVGVVAAGYLLLLPTIVALIIPWATRIHLGWLVLHTVGVLAFAAFVPVGPLGVAGRHDVVGLLIAATIVSIFGHLVALDARVHGFVQIERIRALNREARRDHQRLDELNQVLEHSARTDVLTGLSNRLTLGVDLAAARSRIVRRGDRYGIVAVDLDRFKAINDTLGHVPGDGVLRSVAGALARAVRPEDGVYRYGGEEFVLVVRVDRRHDALMAAERVREMVEALGIPHPANPPYGVVTVSVGVVTVGWADLGADDDAWFARADAALYRAKARGRNRVEIEPLRPIVSQLEQASA